MDDQCKDLASKLCILCEQKWPEEFQGKYANSREVFRDWLNEKTNLSVDHILDKYNALQSWVSAIEAMP